MSAIGKALEYELDQLEKRAEGIVDRVKLKVARRPWVFISGFFILGIVVGTAIGG
jgi:hypothetical protein